MKYQKIYLFIILLLALVFCGYLGGTCIEGMSSRRTIDYAYNTQQQPNINGNEGIYYNDIPPGQLDMYILKSEIVPPVCPACPQAAACPRQEKCQPCPACARCPEPAFECKKVPNYSSSNDQYLPRPVLADFSQFGM